MNTITTDDLLDLIADAADALEITPTIDAQHFLDEWHIAKTATTDALPEAFSISDASQAAADILADALKVSQFGDSFDQMLTDEGLRLEQWSTVLWIEEPGTLVVWLGNLEDYDMTHLGRAKFRNAESTTTDTNTLTIGNYSPFINQLIMSQWPMSATHDTLVIDTVTQGDQS